jgi:hypothetical protein
MWSTNPKSGVSCHLTTMFQQRRMKWQVIPKLATWRCWRPSLRSYPYYVLTRNSCFYTSGKGERKCFVGRKYIPCPAADRNTFPVNKKTNPLSEMTHGRTGSPQILCENTQAFSCIKYAYAHAHSTNVSSQWGLNVVLSSDHQVARTKFCPRE